MKIRRLIQHVSFSVIVVLLFTGCGQAPADTVAPATPTMESETATPISPTDTSAPTTDVSAPTTDVQEGEVTEVVLQVQAREGNPVAEGGAMLPVGESISFDAVGRPESGYAGFWRSMDNAKYTVVFRDQDGQVLALVELQGTVRWDKGSNLLEGAESFLRIQVESGIWLDIVDRGSENGHLTLTDENGDQYLVFGYGAFFEGVMSRE